MINRTLIMKKCWKLSRLKNTRKNPLKSAWLWYYEKIAKELKIKISINKDIEEYKFRMLEKKIHIELEVRKENNKYKIYLYNLITNKEITAEIKERKYIKREIVIMCFKN